MSKNEQPVCKAALTWLRQPSSRPSIVLARQLMPALTGQDVRALSAFVHMVELYATADPVGQTAALTGMRAALLAMQRKCWPVAKSVIPHVMDWPDEERVWTRLAVEG